MIVVLLLKAESAVAMVVFIIDTAVVQQYSDSNTVKQA